MAIQFGPLVVGQSTTGFGPCAGPNQRRGAKTFHVQLTGSGAVSATIQVMVSNTTASSAVLGNWVTHGTITISGTSVVSDGYVAMSPWKFYRPYVSAISGTNASLDIYVGEETR